MKKTCLALAVFAVSGWNHLSAQTLVNFDSIQFWVGSGSNRAAMVIDWKDTSQSSFAWGYRWNGAASGYDMISAIAGNIGTNLTPAVPDGTGDVALTLFTKAFSFGLVVDTFRYQFGLVTLAEGGFDPNTAGYWAYYTADGITTLPGVWESSNVGMTDRVLANNSWDAWTWAENFDATVPVAPIAAIPEPGTVLLLLGGGLLVVLVMRRRRRPAFAVAINPERSRHTGKDRHER